MSAIKMPYAVAPIYWRVSKLNPKRHVPKTRHSIETHRTSRWPKLDTWNKTKLYPNPLTYRGAFEAKRNENFCRPQIQFEELSQKIKATQDMQITSPSPLHMVWLKERLIHRPWWEVVVARKLGLNWQEPYIRQLVPNTPHHNRLLWQIKHLIRIKPVTFPDGIPTEQDMGRVRFEEHSGACRISDSFKVSKERLEGDVKPTIFEPRMMRSYLRKLIGIFGNNWK